MRIALPEFGVFGHAQFMTAAARVLACAIPSLLLAQGNPGFTRRDIPFSFRQVFSWGGPADLAAETSTAMAGRTDREEFRLSVLLNRAAAVRPASCDGLCAWGPVALGDFNRDGKLDVVAVAAGECGRHGHILLGRGDGTFEAPRALPEGALVPVAAGDFNGDGKLDIATIDGMFPGNGDGTFGRKIDITIPVAAVPTRRDRP